MRTDVVERRALRLPHGPDWEMFQRCTSAMYIAAITLSCVACTGIAQQMVEQLRRAATEAVRRELVRGDEQIELRTRGNAWGEGLFVYAIGDSQHQGFVWLYVRERIYALGKEELAMTPSVPLLVDAPRDVQGAAGVTGVSRKDILESLTSPAPKRRSGREPEDFQHRARGRREWRASTYAGKNCNEHGAAADARRLANS